MRVALVIALLAVNSAASAEAWTKYVDGPKATTWSYDASYSYKDRQTGRLVVMTAIAKPSEKLGPAGPGKPDGVGNIFAIDCANKNMIMLGSYNPSAPLEVKATWRGDTPKKVTDPGSEALMAAVCPQAEHVPARGEIPYIAPSAQAGRLSVQETLIGDIIKNEKAKAALERVLPQISEFYEQVNAMTLAQVAPMSQGYVNKENMDILQVEFDRITAHLDSDQSPQVEVEAIGGAIDVAKAKCVDLGFKAGTPKFGDCVLKLSR